MVPPGYVTTQIVVFLMALHRIKDLVGDLTTYQPECQEEMSKLGVDTGETKITGGSKTTSNGVGVGEELKNQRKLWPISTPCAVIERASCPDQRVIRTTLEWVVDAIDEEGSRPPGLLVLGKACEVLHGAESGRKWVVEEGFGGVGDEWDSGLLVGGEE